MSDTRSPRQEVLHRLVTDGTVQMTWAPEVMQRPPAVGSSSIKPDRVRGMLLGLAIGDALGNRSESMLPHQRRTRYGEIRDYQANPYVSGSQIGLPSDDTQLAFWMLEHLLEYGHIEPNELASKFCSGRIFGIGRTTRAFVTEWRKTRDWRSASQVECSAGNGALMRIAPVAIFHGAERGADVCVDAVFGTAVTHNDRAAVASSIAFVGILAELLSRTSVPPHTWWIDTFRERAAPIEGNETRYQPRTGRLLDWCGPVWRFVDEFVLAAYDTSTLQAAEHWYSGAYLLETVPTVLHILMRHAPDPEEAIIRAVNDTKDNDTIAAIVGAAVGALHGESALPRRWRDGLAGRVVADIDDGKLFELIDKAAQTI